MDSTSIKDVNGTGKWILILGCPLKEKHTLTDDVQKVSGPTFSDCASCKFHRGKDFVFYGDETGEFPFTVHPDRLKCGFSED